MRRQTPSWAARASGVVSRAVTSRTVARFEGEHAVDLGGEARHDADAEMAERRILAQQAAEPQSRDVRQQQRGDEEVRL
jgi:hypothetical protein